MILVCGYGVVGRHIGKHLRDENMEYVAIDINPEIKDRYPYVILGDARDEMILKKAGIEKADALVACTSNDITNAFIILTGLSLCSRLTVLCRAEKLENVDKLYKAGADYVVPRSVITSRMLVKHAISPYIAEFISTLAITKDIEIANISIPEHVANKKISDLKWREKTGVSIIAIKRGGKTISPISGDTVVVSGDRIVVIGKRENVKELSTLIFEGDKKVWK